MKDGGEGFGIYISTEISHSYDEEYKDYWNVIIEEANKLLGED
jgi:hypothetical protein